MKVKILKMTRINGFGISVIVIALVDNKKREYVVTFPCAYEPYGSVTDVSPDTLYDRPVPRGSYLFKVLLVNALPKAFKFK